MTNDAITNFNEERSEGTSKQFERNSFSVDETWSKEKKRIMLDAYDQLAKTTNKNEPTSKRESNEFYKGYGDLNDYDQDEEETNETKNYNLNRNTPVYHGRRDENIERWITLINNNMKLAGVPKQKKLLVLGNYVKDTALNMYMSYIKQTIPRERDYEGFLTKLMQLENPEARKEGIKEKLFNIKVEQFKNLDEYVSRFQEFANETDMRENDLVFLFKKGLKPRARFEIEIREPDNLFQAISIATKYEDSYQRTNIPNSQTKVNFISNQKKKGKFNSQKNQNNQRYKNDSDSKKNKVKCYNCEKEGHYASECKTPIKCKKCQKLGHKANECKDEKTQPKDKKNTGFVCTISGENLLTIEGSVHNIKTDKIVFDTGATRSIISEKFVLENKLNINKADYTVKVADTRIVKPIGHTDKLSLNIKGMEWPLSFIILKHDDNDILLGLDFFNLSGASICPSEKLIKFENNRTVRLSSNGSFDMFDTFLTESMDTLTIEDGGEESEDDEFEDIITWNKNEDLIKPGVEIPKGLQSNFEDLVEIVSKNVAYTYKDLKGGSKVEEFKIRLKDQDKIVFTHPYRKSEKEKSESKMITDELLEAGILRYSTSPHSSPFFLVKKPGKAYRPVEDFKLLNSITIKEDFPIPLIDDILFKMKKARLFTVADAKAGFLQVPVEEKSKELTAFNDGTRKLEWNFMPQGIMNAPMVFSRIMNRILGDLEFVVVYIDDICIFSETLAEHLNHVKLVMEKLHEVNLKINPNKCSWIKNKIKLLGFELSDEGVRPDPDKVEAILQRKPPHNVKSLQSFIGGANYYRGNLKGFANIVSPLYDLLVEGKQWEWTNECQTAFETLKENLASFPVLRQPNMNQQFIIHVDASDLAMGAILSQIDETNMEYVVAYYSKRFKSYERNMSVSEKEMAAIILAIKHWRHYITGVKFKIITDHMACKYYLSMKNPTGKLARWAIFLSQFEFEIEHRKGKDHSNADMMSRPVFSSTIQEDDFSFTTLKFEPYEDDALMYYLKYRKHKPGAARKQINRIDRLVPKYDYLNGELYQIKGNSKLLIPKIEDRNKIIDENHAASAHMGIDSTMNRIREKYIWPKMYKQIEDFKRNCKICIRNDNHLVYNHPAMANKITNINDEISFDFVFGLDQDEEGYCGALTIIEDVSNNVKIYPVKTKSIEENVTNFIDYFCTYGPPKRIRSDNEAAFTSSVMNELKKSMGIEWHKTVAAYSPSHNGLIEKFNDTFATALRKLAEKDRKNWRVWLPFIELAYRTRVNPKTKLTPYEILYGIKCNHFENWTKKENEEENESFLNRIIQIKKLVSEREQVIETIEKSQEKQKEKQNRRTKRIMRTFLDKGTVVYRKNDGMITKLEPRWIGPYKIVDNDSRGNYLLIDQMSVGYEKKIPLEKLKVVNEEQYENVDDIQEIKKILNDRTKDNKIQYYVRWKGKSNDSWVNEDDFNQVDIINNYWKEKNEVKPKRGRPRKIVQNLPLYSIFLITMIMPFISLTNADVTKYCLKSEHLSIVNLDTACKWIHNRVNLTDFMKYEKNNQNVIVMKKKHHKVSGDGYFCQVETRNYNFSTNFIGVKTNDKSDWLTYKLDSEECWRMVQTHTCIISSSLMSYIKRMTCDKNGCWSIDEPEPRYSWLRTNNLHAYKCQFHISKVIALDEKSEIFSKGTCTFNKFHCRADRGILVWNSSIIHTCPFEIKQFQKRFKWDKDTSSLINSQSSIILNPVKRVKECGIPMFETNQGLHVALDQYEATLKSFKVKTIEIEDISNQMILANIDFNQYKELRWFKEIDKQICSLLWMTLNLYSHHHRKYLKISNNKGNKVILYTEHGIVYVPECISIYKWEVVLNISKCYKELEIKFMHNNYLKSGFINNLKIITSKAKVIDCDEPSNIIMTTNGTIIQRTLKKVNIIKVNFNKIILNLIRDEMEQLNTHHSNTILDGSDQMREFMGLLHESDIEAYVKPTEDILEKEFFQFDYFNENSLIIYTIFALIVTILSFTVVVWLYKRKMMSQGARHMNPDQFVSTMQCISTNKIETIPVTNAELNENQLSNLQNDYLDELNQRAEDEVIMEKIILNLKEDLKNNEAIQKTNERLKNLLN